MKTIRAAQLSDVDEIAQIEAESYPPATAAGLEDFRNYLSDPKKQGTILVAEDTGSIIGFLGFEIQDGNRMYLWDIAVQRDQRSKGIARWLLAALIQNAKARNLRSIFLKVSSENNSAQRLYAGFNFQSKERLENYYGAGRHALLLELTI